MKYHQTVSLSINIFYQVLISEELKYFKFYNKQITSLAEGTKIHKQFYTKLHHEAVNGTMKVVRNKPNQLLELRITYPNGIIRQSFKMKENNEMTDFIYEEDNTFNDQRLKMNYRLVSIFYKLFFNLRMRKRVRYIQSLGALYD